MCGIAAVFAYGESAPPVDRDEVLKMRERMFSRGPDGKGEWFSDDGRVANNFSDSLWKLPPDRLIRAGHQQFLALWRECVETSADR